tara:strand:- start:512 stop:1051 length:540 start_codon:yes stop_codon:yes gene_type:complete
LIIYYYNWKKKFNQLLIFVFTFIDYVNACFFSNKKIERKCFLLLKTLLFDVEGSCHHSGKCCQHIQIKYDGKWIKSEGQFNKITAKDPNMLRFTPNNKGAKVDYFTCHCLTESNLCSKYESRPKFCQLYPFSVLVSGGDIHPGCGYYIVQKEELPFFASKLLKTKVWSFKFNQSIISAR